MSEARMMRKSERGERLPQVLENAPEGSRVEAEEQNVDEETLAAINEAEATDKAWEKARAELESSGKLDPEGRWVSAKHLSREQRQYVLELQRQKSRVRGVNAESRRQRLADEARFAAEEAFKEQESNRSAA